MKTRNILFLTGTRADFGKLKSLIDLVDESPLFECSLFVTGMHTLAKYGYTVDEVYRTLGDSRLSSGFRRVHTFMNQVPGDTMECILANTITGLSKYVQEFRPDMIVVHGDRVEAMAGAIVGSLRNILVAHIEGGEISGTVDEIIRHAISKMAHVHFVANDDAARRLKQLGEQDESIFVIGSPDIDIMMSDSLPDLDEVKRYYEIPYDSYGIAILHPVTTDIQGTKDCAQSMATALVQSNMNFIIIYPNNDTGSEWILQEYEHLDNLDRFRTYPSLRMEYFLTLLKNANLIIGNSSVGIRESIVYGIPSINIGSRQSNRFEHQMIRNVTPDVEKILKAMVDLPDRMPCSPFGKGDSAIQFVKHLSDPTYWERPVQKQFHDRPLLEFTELI